MSVSSGYRKEAGTDARVEALTPWPQGGAMELEAQFRTISNW